MCGLVFTSELVRYKAGGFKVFTVNDGLPPGAINEIHVDRAGRLWLASSQGLTQRVDDGASARPTPSPAPTRAGAVEQ